MATIPVLKPLVPPSELTEKTTSEVRQKQANVAEIDVADDPLLQRIDAFLAEEQADDGDQEPT